MEQLEFFSIPSPCIGICRTDEKGYCLGCLRSREERLYWLKMSDGQKQLVLRLCRIRRCKKAAAKTAQAENADDGGDVPVQETLFFQPFQ